MLRRVSETAAEARDRADAERKAQRELAAAVRRDMEERCGAVEGRFERTAAAVAEAVASGAREVAEVREDVRAAREEQRRAAEAAAQRSERVMEAARTAVKRVADGALLGAREGQAQVAVVREAVERLEAEVEALRGRQIALSGQVEAEMSAGRAALGRAAAAHNNNNSSGPALEAELAERWRAELGNAERRLAAEIARCRAEIAEEGRRRERAATDLQTGAQRLYDMTTETVSRLQQRQDATREDQQLLHFEERESPRQKIVAAPSSLREPPDVATLRAELETLVAEQNREAALQMKAHVDRSEESLREVHEALDSELAAREELEAKTSRALKSSVASVARALNKELDALREQAGALELRSRSVEDWASRLVEERAGALEEALVVRVAEREAKLNELRAELASAAHELRAELFKEADRTAAALAEGEKRAEEKATAAATRDCAALVGEARAELDGRLAALASRVAEDAARLEAASRESELATTRRFEDLQKLMASLVDSVVDKLTGVLADFRQAQAREECAACVRDLLLQVERDAEKEEAEAEREALEGELARVASDLAEVGERRDREAADLAGRLAIADADRADLRARLESSDARLAGEVRELREKLARVETGADAALEDLRERSEVDRSLRAAVDTSADAADAEAARGLARDVAALRAAVADQSASEARFKASLQTRLEGLEAAVNRSTQAWVATVHKAVRALQSDAGDAHRAAAAGPAPAQPAARARVHTRSVFPKDALGDDLCQAAVKPPSAFFPGQPRKLSIVHHFGTEDGAAPAAAAKEDKDQEARPS